MPPTGRRILVVDDEPGIVSAVSETLRLHGYEVASASDGHEALVVAARFRPEAVILDVMMPKENGYRVSRTLKSAERPVAEGGPPTVLLVTARRIDDDPEREKMFLDFSMADAILYKPFRLSELVGKLKELLG